MCSCDQSLVTVAFLWEKLSQPQFYKDLTRKTAFFEGWSWFKFNNLGLTLVTNLKFYTSGAKGLKLNVKKFWGLISTFVEVGKTGRGGFLPPPPTVLILKRVKQPFYKQLALGTQFAKQLLGWNIFSKQQCRIPNIPKMFSEYSVVFY